MPDSPFGSSLIVIGVDGGATEVKAHHVVVEGAPDAPTFRLGTAGAARRYERVAGFQPMGVADQLKQRGQVELTPAEREQGRRYVAAACEAIVDVARQSAAKRLLVGMGMPGLKTPDGRGIEVINNGPRIPDFLPALERGLADAGLELLAPVWRLGSDADYCGLGEEHADGGLFRDVENAYYVGGGTGIADAMKLHGRLVPFDQAKSWIQKAWQIPSSEGATFEKLVSASGINLSYAQRLGASAESLAAAHRFPEAAALKGEAAAIETLDEAASVLAELIFERIHTVRNGREEVAGRGDAYLSLSREHPYRGTLLDRVVIGQRVGRIYGEPRFAEVFQHKLDRSLARYIAEADDDALRARYLEGGSLRARAVVASNLRAAPALGAAIDAVRSCPSASRH